KHGMMTVRPAAAAARGAHAEMDAAPHAAHGMAMDRAAPWPPVPVMGLLSFVALAAGVASALLVRAAGAKALSDFMRTRTNCYLALTPFRLAGGRAAELRCVKACTSACASCARAFAER